MVRKQLSQIIKIRLKILLTVMIRIVDFNISSANSVPPAIYLFN